MHQPHQNAKSSGLCVPIKVAALCLSKADADKEWFAQPMHNFASLPYRGSNGQPVNKKPYNSESVVAQPFQSVERRKAGVYVHWELPSSYSKGVQQDTGDVVFKNAPNWWLITRIITRRTAGGEISTEPKPKCWVVESDYISNDRTSNSISIPMAIDYEANQLKPFAFLGRVTPYEQWQAESNARYFKNLTVVGFGEPAFAGFFPNSNGVFGFYDDLSGIDLSNIDPADVKLKYIVVGRYRERSQDPFLHYASAQEALADLEWEVDSEHLPEIGYTLYHGVVTDVPYCLDCTRNERPLDPVFLAIGNNSTEALSALLARGDRGLESQLNALQLGMLSATVNVDLEQLKDAVHQNAFGAYAVHQQWEVKPKEKNGSEAITPVIHIPSLGSDLTRELAELNRLQTQFNEYQEKRRLRQWQLFADWYKFVALKDHVDDGQEQSSTFGRLRRRINDIQRYVDRVCIELERDRGPVSPEMLAQQERKVRDLLGEDKRLVQVPGSRYWRANDPTLLILGKAVRPSEPLGGHGGFTDSGYLKCRLTQDVITHLRYQSEDGNAIELAATEECTLPDLQKTFYPQAMRKLIEEAVLLDSFQVRLRMLDPSADENSPIAALVESLAKAAPANESIAINGVLPSQVAFDIYKQPAVVRAEWKARFAPVKEINDISQTYSPQWIQDDFTLANRELEYRQASLALSQPYEGSTDLSSGTRSTLGEQIQKLLDLKPPPALREKLKCLEQRYKNTPIQSLNLEGFHEALSMKLACLQMNVCDPLNPFREEQTEKIRKIVADANTHGPLPLNWYNPIRVGLLHVTSLQLVDVFGQTQEIIKENAARPKIIYAASLEPPTRVNPRDNQFFLPPRLSQSGQLHFRWQDRASSAEFNGHPDRSPICGWVMPNHLDNSLAVYDSLGVALGSLVLSGENTRWRNAPGQDPDRTIAEALRDTNPYFRDSILRIYNNGRATFLRKLQELIEKATATTDPDYYQEATEEAVLIGRPLVFARVSLGLQVQGLPGLNQSWEAFEHTITEFIDKNEIRYETRPTNDFLKVKFPVRLGNGNHNNDGLVGYFAGVDFDTFYSSLLGGDIPNGFKNPDGNEPIALALDDASAEATLLLDPRFQVHAISGIQPVKAIDIPSDLYVRVLQQLQITFLTAPIITNALIDRDMTVFIPQELALPLPNTKQGQWSWIELADEGWREIHEITEITEDEDTQKKVTIHQVDEKESKSMHPLAIREGWLRFRR